MEIIQEICSRLGQRSYVARPDLQAAMLPPPPSPAKSLDALPSSPAEPSSYTASSPYLSARPSRVTRLTGMTETQRLSLAVDKYVSTTREAFWRHWLCSDWSRCEGNWLGEHIVTGGCVTVGTG